MHIWFFDEEYAPTLIITQVWNFVSTSILPQIPWLVVSPPLFALSQSPELWPVHYQNPPISLYKVSLIIWILYIEASHVAFKVWIWFSSPMDVSCFFISGHLFVNCPYMPQWKHAILSLFLGGVSLWAWHLHPPLCILPFCPTWFIIKFIRAHSNKKCHSQNHFFVWLGVEPLWG